MRESIDECYERLGRYLNPDITADPIEMGSGNRYRPYQGRCSRTGIEGQIINHIKSDQSVVPTYTKLLWMVAYQNRVDASSYRLSFGCIAILPDIILSTHEWAIRQSNDRIPGLRVLNTKEIIRHALTTDHYLFLSFGKNIDRNFGNELRFSSHSNMEINGEFVIGRKPTDLDLTNQSVDLTLALRLADLKLDWDDVWRYYELRNKQMRGLTENEQTEVLRLKAGFGEHGTQMVRLSRQLSQQDLRLARWLSQ